MKAATLYLNLCLTLLIGSGFFANSYGQTGIECVWCKGMNGQHNPGCPYLGTKKPAGSSPTPQINLEQEIMLGIFKALLSPPKQNNAEPTIQEKQKMELEKKVREKELADKMTRLKIVNDSIAQARHDKMMKEYKRLEGSGNLTYKGLDDKKQEPIVHFNCKITFIKGDVLVFKSDGKIIKLSESTSVDLNPGDWLATGENSRVKIHYDFEKDGEDVMLGQSSALTILKEENGTHIPKILKGNFYSTNNLISEKIAETTEDLISKSKKLILKYKQQVRVPTAICGVRGTEFTIHVDSLGNTIVFVMHGVVDLMSTTEDLTVTLSAGEKGFASQNGEFIGPVKFDETELTHWWVE